jgi:hypothetical protein
LLRQETLLLATIGSEKEVSQQEQHVDVAILGSSPVGYTAAVSTARAWLSVVEVICISLETVYLALLTILRSIGSALRNML